MCRNQVFAAKFSKLGSKFCSHVKPTGFANPFMVNYNPAAAALLDLPETGIDYLCGNKLFPGGEYIASVYAGHQFGYYVPQLGDGRAIMIGEMNGWEMQLKGSGKTPFSRFGDGRAVLRSCIREYLGSEAMHNLGIPTTRALCIIGSDENVQRETLEKAAMFARLAPSHIRFGHFEYFYHTGQHQQLRELADFVCSNYYAGATHAEFFEQVVLKTAALIAKWQAAGFAHGVMNTDNMSILGLTIDYGPFGFMEEYKPGYICNHSDHGGRYAFDQQPYIGLWNLHALAQSLTPLIGAQDLPAILDKYQPEFASNYQAEIRRKLGLASHDADTLIGEMLALLEANNIDYTNFFRKLAEGNDLRDDFLDRDALSGWLKQYEQYQPDRELMLTANPVYVLRNYLAENAIRAADNGDYSEITRLLDLLQQPYVKQKGREEYAKDSPDWGKNLEVSCSS